MEIRKASKKQSKLRVGLSAPSGGGKTLSALLIAYGICGDWDKICMIDTENGSGDQYANNKKFKVGEFNIITLQAPFSPERYNEAIDTCEKSGMKVIVIDSITHEWEGSGGCLEINEKTARSKFKGNTWSAWSDTGIRHQKFLNKIVQSSCHVITTVRNKTETAMEGRKVIKCGTKEITREGFEYELTVNFNIDRDSHFATPSKDRTSIFEGTDGFLPSKETGKKLIKWAMDGEKVKRPVFDEDELEKFTPYINKKLDELETNKDIVSRLKEKYDMSKAIENKILAMATHEAPPDDDFDDDDKEEVKEEPKKPKGPTKKQLKESKEKLDFYKETLESIETIKDLTALHPEIQELITNRVIIGEDKKAIGEAFNKAKLKAESLGAFDTTELTAEKVDEILEEVGLAESQNDLVPLKELFKKFKKKFNDEQKDKIVKAVKSKSKTIAKKAEDEHKKAEEDLIEEDRLTDEKAKNDDPFDDDPDI